MLDNKVFEKRKKLVVEAIQNIKRKRPIQNQRLDSFAWWTNVEFQIQEELFRLLERLKYGR